MIKEFKEHLFNKDWGVFKNRTIYFKDAPIYAIKKERGIDECISIWVCQSDKNKIISNPRGFKLECKDVKGLELNIKKVFKQLKEN